MGTLADIFRTDNINDVLAALSSSDNYTGYNALLSQSFYAAHRNVETISATKTLTDNDYPIQVITPSGANRTVALPAEAITNHPFFISCASGASYSVVVKDCGETTTYATLFAGNSALILSNGTTWENQIDGRGLTYVAKTVATANLTLVEGKSYLADISGMTADRDIILPTPSAAGKECEIVLTTDAPADYEAVVKVNGVELTRLLVSGEKLKFVSTGSAAGDWIVIDDGRIPCYATLYLSVDQTGVATATTTQVELDSILSQRGGIADLTNNKIVGRRAGTYNVSGSVTYTNITGTYIWSEILVNAKRVRCLSQASSSRLPLPIPTACIEIDAGDDFMLNTQHNSGSDQTLDGAGQLITFMTVEEIL